MHLDEISLEGVTEARKRGTPLTKLTDIVTISCGAVPKDIPNYALKLEQKKTMLADALSQHPPSVPEGANAYMRGAFWVANDDSQRELKAEVIFYKK
jgi:hypothetical protein